MEFEKNLKRLEDIVVKMEGGDLSLEDSLKFFEEGIKLSRDCHKELNEAEQKIKVLVDVDVNGDESTRDLKED